MPPPPISPSLEALGDRPFSFYPPIVNIEHNEWQFRKTTWSEVLVVNRKTGGELWMPRRYFGEISRIDEPVVIVGLTKELEYKGGTVWPFERRVIEMPTGGVAAPPAPGTVEPAPVRGAESPTDVRLLRLVGFALVIGILAYAVMASFFREGVVRPRVRFGTADQAYLELRAHDDYWGVVQKLGPPANDRWMSQTGEIQYRALSYPQRKFTIILMGTERNAATYVGALDDDWKPLHSVPFRSGGNTFSMLRGLKRF